MVSILWHWLAYGQHIVALAGIWSAYCGIGWHLVSILWHWLAYGQHIVALAGIWSAYCGIGWHLVTLGATGKKTQAPHVENDAILRHPTPSYAIVPYDISGQGGDIYSRCLNYFGRWLESVGTGRKRGQH